TVHGRNYYADRGHRRLAYRAVSSVAAMVAVSEDVKRFVVERTGVSANRVRVVYNGIGTAGPGPPAAPANPPARLRLSTEARVVVVLGSLYGVKGHEYLLAAMPSILQACPSTVVLIAGRGEREAALKEQARRLGVDHRIQFLGLRGDVSALLAISDVFVQP